MHEYHQTTSEMGPLSIAVFGSPGSGKSYAIREIAASLSTKGREQRHLTFNLSQFTDATALFSSRHQVRDEALLGATPLVFWDEFDSNNVNTPLGWLRYFLPPMEDGQFTEGEGVSAGPKVTHLHPDSPVEF